MTIALKPLKPEDAIRALQARGSQLEPSFAWQDVYASEHAAMFTVARSAGFDILQDIFKGLSKALSEGRTFRDFSREVTPLLQAKGWWGRQIVTDPVSGEQSVAQLGSVRRLQTIFDANMRVSYAAGHWANFERNKASRPYLRYVAILDDRTRPEHAARHNLCLPVDHPYWNLWAPPCGWNCRCTLQSLSQREVDRMRGQLKFEPPADLMRSWVNKRTGEVREIPQGIDPGWDHNPGRSNAEAAINDALAQKAAAAPVELAEALIRERLQSDAFKRFLQQPVGSMPVMALAEENATAIGAGQRVAIMPATTAARQRAFNPEIQSQDYRGLPAIGSNPTLVLVEGGQSVLLRRDGETWLAVTISTDTAGKAPIVLSVSRMSENVLQQMLADPSARVVLDRRNTL
ncbi:phage head morphogenesis protein